MANQTAHIFIITDRPFNLDTLPASETRHIYWLETNPERITRTDVKFGTRRLLEEMKKKGYSKLDRFFIILEATPNTLAALIMLEYTFWQMECRPELWVIKGETGFYLSYSEEIAEAMDFLQTIKISNLEK